MDIDETIRGRRSIRKYKKTEIPDSVVGEILDLARHAPSSMNGQPWHFIVVRREETKRRLAEIKNEHCPLEKRAYPADFLLQAPVIVVVCVDKEASYDRQVENGILAAANLLLAAHSRGIGSVYMSAYKADDPGVAEGIRHLLGIPGRVDPVSLVPLGYPDEAPEARRLRAIEAMISYERFGEK